MSGRPTVGRRSHVDVAVVGDGPAGLAIAAACADSGLTVRVHGEGRPWGPTYAAWRDEVAMVPDEVFTSITPRVEVVAPLGTGTGRHRIDRAYGVFDNAALRSHLLAALPSGSFEHARVAAAEWSAGPGGLDADLVVVATGADPAAAPSSWQTAHGVVLAEVPRELDLDRSAVTLMDWRQPAGGPPGPASFCYVVPVDDGWLVEETVLAASPACEPDLLRRRLIARLGPHGEEILAAAVRVEEVRIPMGAPRTRSSSRGIVPFGAAAGLIHPATGYSVAASLRAAPRLAAAIAAGDDPAEALWPRPYRRARVLHDYGLDALLRLDAAETGAFFGAFFELPVERWADYLRVDVTPGRLAGVMSRVFRRATWRVRARLMAGDPRVLWRLLAAS